MTAGQALVAGAEGGGQDAAPAQRAEAGARAPEEDAADAQTAAVDSPAAVSRTAAPGASSPDQVPRTR